MKQNFERWHRGSIGGRIAVEIDLVIADGASNAMLQLVYLKYCSAAGIVICCFATGGNVLLSNPPTILRRN